MAPDQKSQSLLDLVSRLSPDDINRYARETLFGRRRLLTGTATVVGVGLGFYALSRLVGSDQAQITLTSSELDSKAQDFINQTSGIWKDFDNAYGYQCEDLANLYSVSVVGGKPFTGDSAWQIFGQQPDRYIMVDYDPNKLPPKGALVVWKSDVGGGNGHVGIAIGEGQVETTNPDGTKNSAWVNVFSQSAAVGDIPAHAPRTDKYLFNNEIRGWMIPKTIDQPTKTAPIARVTNTPGPEVSLGEQRNYNSPNIPYGLNYPTFLNPEVQANQDVLVQENFQRNEYNDQNGSIFVSRLDLSIQQHTDLNVNPNMSLDEYVDYFIRVNNAEREGTNTFGNGISGQSVKLDLPGTMTGYPLSQRNYIWKVDDKIWQFGYYGYTTQEYTNSQTPLKNPFGYMGDIFNQIKDTFVLKG